MSTSKKWILILLVVIAMIQAGIGGMSDIIGSRIFGVSAEHGWHDAIIVMLVAVVVAIAVK